MSTFLPTGYENLKTEKNYWKLSQMKDGENRIRIVSKPIGGWVDWLEKKPYRYTPDNRPKRSFDPAKPYKAFWACYVWDYARRDLYILEITQSGVMKSLTDYGNDADWGDFTQYDIKVNKTGSGIDTRYTLVPVSHKPLSAEIEAAVIEKPVRLEALYEGGDPWNDLDSQQCAFQPACAAQIVPEPTSAMPILIGTPLETLQEHLAADSIDTSELLPYIEGLAAKKGQSVDQVVTAALMPPLIAKFKAAYSKHLTAIPQGQAI